MNQRIRELIAQCTVQEFSDCTGGYETFDQEKFAELIVRECAEVASNQVMDVEGNDWGVRWAVKKHFGVAE